MVQASGWNLAEPPNPPYHRNGYPAGTESAQWDGDSCRRIAVQSRVDPRVIAGQLFEARDRTFLLISPLTDEDLHAQHDPLMSPILWDLGHIAHFEELWLTRNLEGPVEFVEMPGLFNPFEHPRSERGALRLPGMAECREIMDEIRGRVLGRLAVNDFDPVQPASARRVRLQHGAAA